MYNLIFWFFYKPFEWRKGFQSSFIAGAMAGLTLVIHLLLLYRILTYFIGFKLPYFTGNYGQRRLMLLPLVIIFFFILYFGYYKKKTGDILEKYKDKKFSKPKNIFLIILLIAVPLIVVIRLAKTVNVN